MGPGETPARPPPRKEAGRGGEQEPVDPPALEQGGHCGSAWGESPISVAQMGVHGLVVTGRGLQPQLLLPHLSAPTSQDPLSDPTAGTLVAGVVRSQTAPGSLGYPGPSPGHQWTKPFLLQAAPWPFIPRLDT